MSSELQELYQQVILDHGRNPRNFRQIPQADLRAEGFNPLCGDHILVYLKVSESGLIEDLAFQGKGCAICTASASIMTQTLKGRSLESVGSLFHAFHDMVTNKDTDAPIDEALGKLGIFAGVRKYPVRVKCATLPWHTVKASLENQADPVTTE